jgi:putative glycosyltransferase (TIGR04372 family)
MTVAKIKAYIDALPLNISGRFIRPVVRLVRKAIPYTAIFIYTPLAGVFWILRIRQPDFFVDRIGHLLSEPDCFIKEHLLTIGRFPKAMMLAPRDKTANQAVAKYWSKYFVVIENLFLVKLLRPLQSHPWTRFSTHRYLVAMYQTADAYRINAEWGARRPLLELEPSDIERGHEVLGFMGVPEGAWYVCVHAREGLYSPHDEQFHSFRNTPITDLEKTIAYIVSQGGFCIRMGDSTMRPAPKFPGLFDYALSPYKQDWMDLFLSATCKFFLGSNSGAYQMAAVFGRPSALVNMAPLSAIATGVNDIVIPMLYQQGAQGAVLSFKQIFNSSYADFRLTEEFEAEKIVLVRNTPEEILDLAVEQLQRVHGTYATDVDDELRQAQFKTLLQPGHHSYGAASRIGNAFLKKYQHLLDDSGQ